MADRYHVRMSKDYLVFSAAHFITYDGDVCEPLHGHNYRVSAEVHGPLDENHYVVDFIALRDALKRIVDELDHRMLLPTEHPLIRVKADDREVEARFADRRWVFPRGDCVLLPVANTTTELLARHVAGQLAAGAGGRRRAARAIAGRDRRLLRPPGRLRAGPRPALTIAQPAHFPAHYQAPLCRRPTMLCSPIRCLLRCLNDRCRRALCRDV